MKKTNTITNFHKNAPKRLIALYKRSGGNCYVVSKKIAVNPSQVWQLLKNGKEPKRDDIRRRMFLSHKKTPEELEQMRLLRLKKSGELPGYVREFRRLPKEERYKVMQQYIRWRNDATNKTRRS